MPPMPPKDPNPAGPAPMMIPVDDLSPSPLNPRKRPRDIAELAVSVKARGVLAPLLVRIVRDGDMEIVAGERRWRAAKEAGLAEVPATVREIDDVTVIELGVEENCQRNDLTPTEEADAFAELEKRGRSVEQIASLAGRSTRYIRQRLRLRQLVPGIRDLLNADRLDVGGALVLAQLPEATQKKILVPLKDAMRDDQREGWSEYSKGSADHKRVTRTEVTDAVRHYAHELAAASFDPEDETLVPAAGKCSLCPRQTGRQGALFETIDAASICLDEKCYRGKQDADFERKAGDAKKKQLPVLAANEAKKTISNGRPRHDSGLVDVTEEQHVGSGKYVPVAKLVDESVPRTIAQCPDTGRVLELVPRAAVEKASGVAGRDAKRAGKSKNEAAAAKKRKDAERHRAAVNLRMQSLALASIAGAITSGRVPIVRALRLVITDHNYNDLQPVARRRKLELPPDRHQSLTTPVQVAIAQEAVRLSEIKDEKLAVRNLVALLCEVAFSNHVQLGGYALNGGKTPDELGAFGLEFSKLRKVAEQELKDEAKAKTTAKPAAAAKPTKSTAAKKPSGGKTPAGARPASKRLSKPRKK